MRLDLDPTVDPALIDRAGLETALLNLAANARDAIDDCRGDGTVVIRAANETLAAGGQPDGPSSQGHEITPGDYVVVSLSDDGAGMDELTASKAFEPFFTTREIGKGTGLGLSQVYGFARQSGGFVRMRSAPGKGTTVSIYLPRSADRVANAGSGERTAPILLRAASAGEVVLVVEDDDNVRRVAIESLDELGYRTLEAESAPAALRMLREPGRIDILFSDVVMPGGMNGVLLAVQARRLRPKLRVLLTSGYTAAALENDHGALPQVEVLRKPYLREELASRIRLVAEARAG